MVMMPGWWWVGWEHSDAYQDRWKIFYQNRHQSLWKMHKGGNWVDLTNTCYIHRKRTRVSILTVHQEKFYSRRTSNFANSNFLEKGQIWKYTHQWFIYQDICIGNITCLFLNKRNWVQGQKSVLLTSLIKCLIDRCSHLMFSLLSYNVMLQTLQIKSTKLRT